METCVGRVTHFFSRLSVAALALSGPIAINDILHFCGSRTDFYQKVWSMEVEHAPIQSAGPGAEIAVKVAEPVRRGDQVFLVTGLTPEERDAILMEQLRDWQGGA